MKSLRFSWIISVVVVAFISEANASGIVFSTPSPSPSPKPEPSATSSLVLNSPFTKSPKEFEKILVKAVPSVAPDIKNVTDILPNDVGHGPYLESLEGVKAITVRGEGNNIRELKVGGLFLAEDEFQTGKHGVARISYEQGVQVLVATESILKLSRMDGVPLIEVSKGQIRVLIERSTIETAPNSPRPPFRFFVRTESSTMGARGTDFTVTTEKNRCSLHTITGTVEIAPDSVSLRQNAGVKVPAGRVNQRRSRKTLRRPRTIFRSRLSRRVSSGATAAFRIVETSF